MASVRGIREPTSGLRFKKEADEPIRVAKAEAAGKAQTSAEHRAATRGIGLNRDDPEPSLIMLTASTSKNMLVVALNLVHNSSSSVGNTDEETAVGKEEY